MLEGVTSQAPRSPRGAIAEGKSPRPLEPALPDLGSDVFLRSASPEAEAQQIVRSLSAVSMELRSLQRSELTDGKTIPLSEGSLFLKTASPGSPGVPVSRVDLRLHTGPYAVDFSVDENGGVKVRQLYKDGKSMPSILRDALRERIAGDPLVWGSLSVLAATGVVALAHEYVRKTGDPVRVNVLDKTVMRDGPWSVRVEADAELTGDSRFIRPLGAGPTLEYADGKVRAELGARYRPGEKWEANASASYALAKDVDLKANARYREDDYRVGVSLEARF